MTQPKAASKDEDGFRLYKIPHPETGEILELPSYSTLAQQRYNWPLENWKQAQIATVIANREDLHLLALHEDTAKEAIKAAKGLMDQKANRGTAIHRWAQELEDGMSFTLPQEMRKWIAPYQVAKELYQWKSLFSEVTLFSLEGRYACTIDMIADFPSLGVVATDLKTGRSIWPEVAMQLAAAANASWGWDSVNGQLISLPPRNKKAGVIIHLHETEDGVKCDLKMIDLTGAYEALCGLSALYWHGKQKGVVRPLEVPQVPPPNNRQLMIDWVNFRLPQLDQQQKDDLLKRWGRTGIPTLKSDHAHSDKELDTLLFMAAEFEGAWQMVFEGPLYEQLNKKVLDTFPGSKTN